MSDRTGVCNFCGTGCGHILDVTPEGIRGVFASPGHPVSRGRLCVRGWHIHELLSSRDRILHPLVRKNGRLEKVSHEEAVTLAASRLSALDGREIGFLASPRSSNEDNYLLSKLARSVYGSNNISLASDSGHRSAVDVLLEGTGVAAMSASLADIRSAEVILVVGADITKLNPIIGSEIHLAARNGAALVTLSSRSTQIAKLSAKHLWIRPGTKRIALAAIAGAMIHQGWQDREFIKKHTRGFETFAASLADLDLGKASSEAGLPFAEIEDFARTLAGAGSAMAFFPSGISGLDRETVAVLFDLFLAAGKIGRPGCGVNPVTGICNIVGSYDMGTAPDLLPGYAKTSDPAASIKFASLWQSKKAAPSGRSVNDLLSAEPMPLKALVVVDHDEEIIRRRKAVEAVETVIYIGAYANEFQDLADIVIPSATYAESDGTFTNTERRIQLNGKKIEPPAGVRPAWRIFADLAAASGAAWPYAASSDVMAEIGAAVSAYGGATYGKLEKSFGLAWPCDTAHPEGRPSLSIEDFPGGFRFVGFAGAGSALPGKEEGFPVALVAGKANHFWHRNNIMKKTHIPKREYNALLLLYPKGFVEISREDAAAIGVRDKSPVAVTSAGGSLRVAARVSGDVKPGTAYVPYFIQDMIAEFLDVHDDVIEHGEDAVIPVRIEKV